MMKKWLVPTAQLLAVCITSGLTVLIISFAERTTGFLFNLYGVIEALLALGILGTALFSLVTAWLIHLDNLTSVHWYDHLRQSIWLYTILPFASYGLIRWFSDDRGSVSYVLLILVTATAVWGIIVNLTYLFDIQPKLTELRKTL